MKTVSGKLISSKPISLSKAAKILSGFASHEHGASDAVSVYLNRAADAFNNLVCFHKELKNPQSYSKHRTPHVKTEENSDVGKVESRRKSRKNADFELKIEEKLEAEEVKAALVFEGNEGKDLRKKRQSEKGHKKEIKIEQISNGVGEEKGEKRSQEKVKIKESMEIDQATPDEAGEKRKKKKHKKEEVRNEEHIKIEQSQDGESGCKEMTVQDVGEGKRGKQESPGIEKHPDDTEEEGSVKKREKKKRKKRDDEGAGGSMELEEGKNRDVDGEETIDLAEQSGKKKKKRRKTENEDKLKQIVVSN